MNEHWEGYERPGAHDEGLERHVRELETGYARLLERTPEESWKMVEHLAGCEVCRTRYLDAVAGARFAKGFAEAGLEWAEIMGSCLAMGLTPEGGPEPVEEDVGG